MYKESFLMAWASLIANKMRSILTMLGIIIGVAAVIALVSIGNGVKQDIQNSISSLGSNLLMVMPGAPRTPGVRPSAGSMKSLKVSDYEAISKLDGVKAASPMTNGSYVVIYQNKNWTTSVSGVSYNYLDVNNWSMKSGRFLSEKNVQNRERVAVVGKTVVKNLFGDEDPVGAEIRVKNIPFRIIGVLNSKGSGAMGNDQDDMVIIPYTTAMERVEGVDYLRMIYVVGKDENGIDRLQSDIENLLRVRHGIKDTNLDDFNIQNMNSIMETMEETTGTLTLFLGAVAAISLVVGGIGIMNIMLVSVTERTREIGVRKALGATYSVIVTQFLIEAVVISLMGGIIGIILGIGSSKLIGMASGMSTVISVPTIVMSFAFSMAIGLIFGIYPARKAAKLNPIDALHYE
ncbi:MAG TPA: multidrug ABC transporter substrate-binding protein [Veillonella dispar]|jgi:putative ABC transport system permease protein|uniref:ABC transporter permease n=1 Tax=Veillonella TaxID=29465 RepID=UPI000ED3A211|nr:MULTISPECIES: ABC transporter permease [unclassified Veillonella]HCK94702.1 multidrug ABC transporter substrate-binding protein [Veillonella dispar]MDU4104378.1 ABC transporter permease [Veillonella sp.]MDU4756735.1 ABC transporter permease [Veillonella sp.]MDU5736377.1 ABC transporter permease [Veillonella sp.]MDU5866558.1 ABC transporter permease [Veillonella sp.]